MWNGEVNEIKDGTIDVWAETFLLFHFYLRYKLLSFVFPRINKKTLRRRFRVIVYEFRKKEYNKIRQRSLQIELQKKIFPFFFVLITLYSAVNLNN